MTPVLRVRGLGYRYPDGTTALTGIDLDVRRGEIVAVLGPSGAGKSTLFRCLAGLHPPTAGVVELDGIDLNGLRGRARRDAIARIGLVFQEFQIVGRATVLSNVLVGRLSHSRLLPSLLHLVKASDRAIAVDLVARIGLAPQLRKRADALSGGQRQRVAVARALAQQPHVLLADEPVANLDPVLAAAVVDDIAMMVHAEGLTAVLNLHDVSLARRLAGRIVGMRDGEVQFDLPTPDVTDAHLSLLYGGSEDNASLKLAPAVSA